MPQARQLSVPNPARTIAMSFLGAIAAGTFLLWLPLSSVSGHTSLVDAFFTATSAVCVTGLIVVDTGTHFTRFGQTVILVLIQLGGLGIMTFSVFFFSLLGKRATLKDRLAFRAMGEGFETPNLLRLLTHIFLLTLFLEGIGTGLLFLRFREVFPPSHALFHSLFQAVSAFCNAGFSLFADSLMGFQREFLIPGVTMLLLVLGGVGFFVLLDLARKGRTLLQKERFRFSLHTKLVLTMGIALLALGTIVIWLLERANVLSPLPLPLQLWNALFQALTPRTAGFNTLDTASLSDATLLFISMLMFIGGAPASTAGGIKVTTMAVLLALVFCKARGKESVSLFKRKIPEEILARSLTIFAASFAFINLVAFLVLLSEYRGLPHGAIPGRFLDLFFEAISAFGTVGLSTGATPQLSTIGKLLIIFTMFAGRIGPLTLALAVVARPEREIHYEYAEEEVMVG